MLRRDEVRRLGEMECSLIIRLSVLLSLGGMLAYGLLSFWRMLRATSISSGLLFFMPLALVGAMGVVAWRCVVVARELRRRIRGTETDETVC